MNTAWFVGGCLYISFKASFWSFTCILHKDYEEYIFYEKDLYIISMHAYSYLLEVPGDSRLFSLYKMNKNKPQQCLQCPFLSFVMLDSKYLALLLTKALFIWRGVGPGHPPPPPPPPPPSQLYCASTWKKHEPGYDETEISVCACSAWRKLAWRGEMTNLKPFTWEKVGSSPRVTLSDQPSDPPPHPRAGLQFLMSMMIYKQL